MSLFVSLQNEELELDLEMYEDIWSYFINTTFVQTPDVDMLDSSFQKST